jgi:hypothetical protein
MTCHGKETIQPLEILAFRIVESQERIATMTLVDTTDEQMLLEMILDDSKPQPSAESNGSLHYLITTPFRYPPLAHGSRFGLRTRPGLFYASLDTKTTLAECAYYRFVFWQGMAEPPPMQRIMTEHTTFAITVETDQGIALEKEPFIKYKHEISHPARYQSSQALGEAMREAQVEAFTYTSARATQHGTNIGIFMPRAIKSKRPLRKQLWSCITTTEEVSFIQLHAKTRPVNFPLQQFLHNDVLPMPAC